MEVKVHGFENLTIQHVQKAFDVLGEALSKKLGVKVTYTVQEKPKENKQT